MAVTTDEVKAVLKKIQDPEIHMSIVDLGLIYGVDVKDAPDGKSKVNVKITLTSPACPYGPQLLSKCHADVAMMPGVSDVSLDLVWTPQWNPKTMASDEVKMQMGILDLDDEEDADGEKAEK
jgi:metal-sulfur cluster biosynthetic enzyme